LKAGIRLLREKQALKEALLAQNYMQWSENLPLHGSDEEMKEQKEWVKKVLTHRDDFDGEDEFESNLKEHGVDLKVAGETEFWPDFGWKVAGSDVWLYSEESGNIDHVIAFVQAYLKKYAPKRTSPCSGRTSAII